MCDVENSVMFPMALGGKTSNTSRISVTLTFGEIHFFTSFNATPWSVFVVQLISLGLRAR